MSRQNSKTPTPDIYTALLFIGAAAMLIAILFLWLSLGKYDFQVTT